MTALTLADWVKQNNLPTALEDVFYEESINNLDQLKHCSLDVLTSITDALSVKMGPQFTSQQRKSVINSVQNINPNICKLLANNNKILNKLQEYQDSYVRSLTVLEEKQNKFIQQKHEMNKEWKDMFESFQSKAQSLVEQQLLQYKRSLTEHHKQQSKNLGVIKQAQKVYITDKSTKNDATKIAEFDTMIENKLKTYDPNTCVTCPTDMFKALQETKQILNTEINHKIDVLLSSVKDNSDNDASDAESECKSPDLPTELPNGALYIECYVSSISQYSLDATGSCTINALEAAIQLQMNRKPSIKLVDEIVHLAALYKQNKHTAVGDIYPVVTRYNSNLERVDWLQITVQNITNIIAAMVNVLVKNDSSKSVSAVLTKPPETIFIHLCEYGHVYIFDSHPRPQLNGSHFLIFDNRKHVESYLKELWPYQNLGAGFNDLRSQQINMLDVTLFQLKSNVTPSKKPDLELMGKELSKIGVSLENKWHQNYGNKKRKPSNITCVKNGSTAVSRWESQALLNSSESSFENSVKSNGNLYRSVSQNSVYKDCDDRFKCELCKHIFTKEDVFVFTNCNCSKICRDCSQKYMTHEFDNGNILNKWPLKCPLCAEGCNEQDFMLISAEIYSLYKEQMRIVSNQFTDVRCPWCNNVQMLKEWRTTKNSIGCPKYVCNFNACKKCFVSWSGRKGQPGHNGLTCDEVKKIMEDPSHYRKCKCRKMVANQHGHKLKKCKCGKKCCFKCGQSFKSSVKHQCKTNIGIWDTIANFINMY